MLTQIALFLKVDGLLNIPRTVRIHAAAWGNKIKGANEFELGVDSPTGEEHLRRLVSLFVLPFYIKLGRTR